MKWHRAGQWFEQSDCGRYTVAAAKVDGRFVFQAFAKPATLLHTDPDAGACRLACERHAQRETATHRARGEQ